MMDTPRSTDLSYHFTEHKFTLQDIYNADQLPLVVKVKDGYYGDCDWETVSAGDVLWLHSRSKYKRAIASDLSSRTRSYYSIPLDYEVPFICLKQKASGATQPSGPALPLRKITEKKTLPVKVQMVLGKNKSFHLSSDPKLKLKLESFEIQDVYDEKYFKANAIRQGRLYKEIMVLPTYLSEVRVVKAEGLSSRNATPEQWHRQLAQWSASAASLHHAAVAPIKEIMVYSKEKIEAANSVYDTIEPSTYVSLCKVSMEDAGQAYTSLCVSADQPPKLPRRNTEKSAENHEYHSLEATPSLQRDLPPVPPKNPLPRDLPPVLPKNPLPKAPLSSSMLPSASAGPEREHEGLLTSAGSSIGTLPSVPVALKVEVEEESLYSVPVESKFIKSLQDIPLDISKLGCQELTECLRLLNMGNYIHTFREQQINGELLKSLEEDMLVSDLGISAMHARKLHMFVHKGWRPD